MIDFSVTWDGNINTIYIDTSASYTENDMYAAHHGTIALFENFGFNMNKQIGNGYIIRKHWGIDNG